MINVAFVQIHVKKSVFIGMEKNENGKGMRNGEVMREEIVRETGTLTAGLSAMN